MFEMREIDDDMYVVVVREVIGNKLYNQIIIL